MIHVLAVRVKSLRNAAEETEAGDKHVCLYFSLMRCLRSGAVEICEGKTENDLPYQWFGGEAKQHPFKLEEGKTYQQLESVICYR